MIFSVTYREMFVDESIPVQEHTTTFEAPSRTEGLGTIVGWMDHRSLRGGIVQVLQINIEDAQQEPIKQEHENVLLCQS